MCSSCFSSKYLLQFTLYFLNIDVTTQYIEITIITSNDAYPYVFHSSSYDADLSYQGIHNGIVADMDANDTAQIRLQIPSAGSGAAQMDLATDSFFSGALIC